MPTFETPLGSGSSLLLPTISKVAVIGAGAAGLPTAKRLRNYGLEVVIFERNPAPGGVWIYRDEKPIKSAFPSVIPSKLDESSRPPEGQELPFTETYDDETIWARHAPPGACYESLINNIETSLMRFQGHEYPPGTGSFVNYQCIVDYLQRFAKDSKLDSITRYNTYVGNVRRVREGGKSSWKVLSRQLHRDELGRTVGTWSEETFDAVVIATGHYHTEYIPDIPGLSEWAKKWPQDIFHSKEFRRADSFDDKNILLFGTGFSSLDIAREISPSAKHIYRVARKEGNTLTSEVIKSAINLLAPKNLTQVAEIERFGPVEHTTQPCEGEIFLKDGTVLKGIDGVSFCTGYLYVLPFLRPFHGDKPPSTSEDPEIVQEADVTEKTFVTDGMRLHNLHKDIFYIQDPTLAFIGVPLNIATFAFFEVQAIAVAAVFAGKAFLPAVSEMRTEYQAREAAKGTGRGFHELGPDLERDYVENVVNWVNRDAEKINDETRVKGYYEGWYEDRVAGMDRLLRSILSREKFYPGLGAQEIEAKVQELNILVEKLFRAAAADGV